MAPKMPNNRLISFCGFAGARSQFGCPIHAAVPPDLEVVAADRTASLSLVAEFGRDGLYLGVDAMQPILDVTPQHVVVRHQVPRHLRLAYPCSREALNPVPYRPRFTPRAACWNSSRIGG